MKTKLLTAVIAAFSLMAALLPSSSQAEFTIPSWEQVGVTYGEYLEEVYTAGTYDGPAGLADILLANLYDTYGPNVAYYFYFYLLAEEIGNSIWQEAYVTLSYYDYIADYYAYLYYWEPGYAEQLYNYFQQYMNDQWNLYYSYFNSLTEYYYDVSDYYNDIVYPK